VHPGVQEDRQAVLYHVRGEALVRGGQAEEARETDGLDAGIDRFQRPAEHLRPHVDAEARLQRRPLGVRPGRRGGEGLGQVALHGAFPGLLQDRVGGKSTSMVTGAECASITSAQRSAISSRYCRNSASSHRSRMVRRSVSVSSVRPQAPPATGGSGPPAPSRPAGTGACAGTSPSASSGRPSVVIACASPRRRCRAFR
jgi:hypothetical protein